jgi:hypothetical protein
MTERSENMSLTGNATNKVLRGRINRLDTLCISAYAIAVQNGFEGTEKEWLASLKGASATMEQIEAAVEAYFAKNPVTSGSSVRVAEVELLAANWVGDESLYSQVVSVPGVTAYSNVSLTPSVEQLSIFYDKDITFVTENDGGVVTVYVIGQKPQNDYTIPANIVEVIV